MVQEYRSLRRLALALTVAVLLGGCSVLRPPAEPPSTPPSPQPQPSMQPPAQPSPDRAAAPQQKTARENHLSPATRSLVTQARAQVAHGDLPAASSTLDRAMRIEPNNPLLWVELGRLRLAESNAHQAEICGRKALALASGDHGAQAQAGRLLADALRAQGRNQEALEVETQPFMN
jgi:cytochrome c-type biogenesis protein CcmH/NrfG